MAIQPQLLAARDGFIASAPKPLSDAVMTSTAKFIAKYDSSAAIQPGTKLPSFTLSDATGKSITSESLLSKGPILINFYRGNWCPFCNIALRGFQEKLAEINAKGVTFVAITPELPDTSLSTIEKDELKFPVLSDVGNVLAGKLGILYHQDEGMKFAFDKLGVDVKERYGDESLVVPVPAVLLVDKEGVVRNTFVDPDFMKRLEPATALEWIDAL